MTVGTLKKLLDYLPDDAQVVIGCEGYSNYNFEEDRYWDGDDENSDDDDDVEEIEDSEPTSENVINK